MASCSLFGRARSAPFVAAFGPLCFSLGVVGPVHLSPGQAADPLRAVERDAAGWCGAGDDSRLSHCNWPAMETGRGPGDRATELDLDHRAMRRPVAFIRCWLRLLCHLGFCLATATHDEW